MLKFKQRKKELSREERLDFAVETMFVCLVLGSVLMQSLMHAFVYPSNNLLAHIIFCLIWSFLSLFSHFPAALIFGLAFRTVIASTDLVKIDANAKMILTILGGLISIFLVQHLFLDFNELMNTEQHVKAVIYLTSFGLPFIFWNFYKNIWFSLSNAPKENPDLLDDIHF